MANKVLLTPAPIRQLSLGDLELTLPVAQTVDDPTPAKNPESANDPSAIEDDFLLDFADETPLIQESELEADDPLLVLVRELRKDGYAGVILTGPPGTGKSWYAEQLALALTDDDTTRVRFLQFHPSYQYEDFVEGYVPSGTSFSRTHKHLLLSCETAQVKPSQLCVMVIDELSRSDPARVFGEALTYVETSKRGKRFKLASGEETAIPPNLFFVCTMNLHDRGVDEVDTAFERRFAKIEMNPDAVMLMRLLTSNGVPAELQERVKRFFEHLQKASAEEARLGHAYFRTVRDEASLQRLWNNQLRFVVEKAFRFDPDGFKSIESAWRRAVPPPVIEVEIEESFRVASPETSEAPATKESFPGAPIQSEDPPDTSVIGVNS